MSSAPRQQRATLRLALRAAVASVYFAAVFFVAIPAWLVVGRAPTAAGAGPLLGGLGAAAIGVAAMLATRLVILFVREGRGTHVPLDPPRQLVATGLYRWLRNPMYALYVVIILGEAALFASWPVAAYAVVFWLVFHAYVVWREEPLLIRRFGASYEAYCRAVPRWLPRAPSADAVAARSGVSPDDSG